MIRTMEDQERNSSSKGSQVNVIFPDGIREALAILARLEGSTMKDMLAALAIDALRQRFSETLERFDAEIVRLRTLQEEMVALVERGESSHDTTQMNVKIPRTSAAALKILAARRGMTQAGMIDSLIVNLARREGGELLPEGEEEIRCMQAARDNFVRICGEA